MIIGINELAERAYLTALRRKQITEDAMTHKEIVGALANEFAEFVVANEFLPSEHLPFISQAEEEVIDILIVCLTELKRRGLDAEFVITKKMEFNEKR